MISKENLFLYLLCILIWGSTWYGVKLQKGISQPEFSVFLRFLAASSFLFFFCRWKNISLRFPLKSHIYFLIQGFCIFFIGYICSYKAVLYITSGVVAVFYCLMPFFNIVFSRLFFKSPIEPRVVIGAALGFVGVAFVFSNEWTRLSDQSGFYWGLIFSFFGAGFGALGNMAAVKMSKLGFSVAAWNSWGMLYGSLMTFTYCLANNIPMVFDSRFSYWSSFLFLSFFGSVIAFGAYYRLQSEIGPSRASYMTVFFPIIALSYSWFFESFEWTLSGVFGVLMVLCGNIFLVPPQTKNPQKGSAVALAES